MLGYSLKIFWIFLIACSASLMLLMFFGVWQMMRLRGKSPEEKLAMLRRIKASGGWTAGHAVNESKILNRLSRHKEALLALAAADPRTLSDKTACCLAKADTYICLNKPGEAAKILKAGDGETSAGAFRFRYERSLIRAKLCLAQNDAENAIASLRKAKRIYAKDPHHTLLLAKYDFLIKDYAAASQKAARLLASCNEPYIAGEASALAADIRRRSAVENRTPC